jgi:serine/threonine protein kinase
MKVIHRDLGARNLLVTIRETQQIIDYSTPQVTKVDEKYRVKITDMGLSRDTNYYSNAEEKEIAFKWSAPEMINFGKSSSASDVWSFGVVLWEVFTNGESKPNTALLLSYPILIRALRKSDKQTSD